MTANPLPALYPLRFREILRAYSFGGRWIPRAFAKGGLPPDHPISETWEVCDRPGESSEILNGPLKGLTLGQAIRRYGELLLGADIWARFGGRFPLLIKLLDATHELGEQCHPNDDQNKAWGLKDFSGKTEGWYLLQTAPGAAVFCGNRPGVTRDKLLAALRQGQGRSCMVEYAARPGDAYLLYAGTMH
jgi:mannose-6-phosphate isomerase